MSYISDPVVNDETSICKGRVRAILSQELSVVYAVSASHRIRRDSFETLVYD